MKKISLLIICVSLFCGTAFSQEVAGVEGQEKPQTTEVQGALAVVKSVKGIATVLKEGADGWKKLSVGDELSRGAQVSVGADSVAVIDIDGNIMTLSRGALLNFKNLTSEMQLELWHGKIKAKVKKLGSSEKFEVYTPVAVCAVRGTEFELVVSGDYTTEVKTISGAVSVKDIATGKEVVVKPGYRCTVGPGMKEPKLELVPVPVPVEEPEEKKAEKKEKEEEAEPAEAEEEKEEKPAPKKTKAAAAGFSVNGSFGADVLSDPDNPDDNKVYYCLSLMPELSIWRFGAGLDINLYFDEEGNMRGKDWDEWGDLVGKIWYVRYCQKGDPLYALFGGVRSYSIGHGFIMSNYTNMLNYPDVRHKGLLLEVNLNKIGFESIISNVDSYPVLGGRLYMMPLGSYGLPLISKLKIGVSGVIDQNPDMYEGSEDDDVLFYGGDCEMPILNLTALNTYAYFDYATYALGSVYDTENNGCGTAIGLGGAVIKKIKYSLEYRKMDNNFIPGYYNTYYEVARSSKPYTIGSSRSPQIEGPFFMLGFDVMNKLDLRFTYENYNIDTYSRYPYFHGELHVDPSLLMNKFTFGVSYDKKNVDTIKDVGELKGAIMTTELGYMIAPNIMLLVTQKQTFDEDGNATKTMSMRTRFRF